jgi:hypothetical protein
LPQQRRRRIGARRLNRDGSGENGDGKTTAIDLNGIMPDLPRSCSCADRFIAINEPVWVLH